jgi:hypothetical protein
MESAYWDFLTLWAIAVMYFIFGWLVGRNFLKEKLEKKLRKEIYEQGKLDGAYEFVKHTLFTGITKG